MEQRLLYGCPCYEVIEEEQVEEFLLENISKGQGGYTAAINALKIVSYNENGLTRQIIDGALIQTPDGFGAQLAFRLKHSVRVLKLDLPGLALNLAQKKKLRLFFLGTTEENNKKAVEKARELYPGINIIGRLNGFFGEVERIEIALEKGKPDMVMISMGSPRQEILSAKLSEKFPKIIFVGSGGRMDILAGKLKRAPAWMQNNGFEWLYRFVQEPQRMVKGPLIGGIKFLKLIFRG